MKLPDSPIRWAMHAMCWNNKIMINKWLNRLIYLQKQARSNGWWCSNTVWIWFLSCKLGESWVMSYYHEWWALILLFINASDGNETSQLDEHVIRQSRPPRIHNLRACIQHKQKTCSIWCSTRLRSSPQGSICTSLNSFDVSSEHNVNT